MKKNIYALLIIAACLLQGSCKKEDAFLNAKPNQALFVPSTLQDLENILNDQNIFNIGDPGLGEIASDDYYVTSDIVLRILDEHQNIGRAVIMVQREVADRIAAEPGSRDYGMLSATAQLYARVDKLFTLPPGAFVPPPKVHSTVLRLTIDPQQDKLGVAGDGFIDFLRLSFGQKRKTLWNNLKAKYEGTELKRALAEAKVKATARAETLSLEESAAVYRALRKAQAES